MRSVVFRGLAAIAGLILALAAVSASAASYPERPITFIVPYAAGGNVDLTARIVAERMEKALGQPVVVENRPGAGGNVAGNYVARSTPDGYTIFVGSNGPLTVNPVANSKTPYDVKTAFEPIGLISTVPLVLAVSPSFPPKTVQELVAYAKQQPGKVKGASGGIASSTHLALELFKLMAGVQIRHIPYTGQGALYPDLMGGHVDLTFDQITTSIPLANNKQIRLLGITSVQRSSLLPDLPTLDELGITGYAASSFVCLVAPAKTSKDILEKLSAALKAALTDPDVRGRLEKMGAQAADPTPQDLIQFLDEETKRTRKVVSAIGLKLD